LFFLFFGGGKLGFSFLAALVGVVLFVGLEDDGVGGFDFVLVALALDGAGAALGLGTLGSEVPLGGLGPLDLRGPGERSC
jgi:hypothetical protein